jgi:hypothetical protein
MVDIPSVSVVIASAGIFVAAIYYILQIRHQTKIRKTDLFMRLWSFGTSDELMDALEKVVGLQFKDYKDYVTKYGSFVSKESVCDETLEKTRIITSQDPTQRALCRVFNFYSLLGALVYGKLIGVESVFHITDSSYPKMLYKKLKPIVLGLRRDLNEPFLMGDFEYLCSELIRKEPQVREMWKKREQKLQRSKA